MSLFTKSMSEGSARRSRGVAKSAFAAIALLVVTTAGPSGAATAQPRFLPSNGPTTESPRQIPMAGMAGEARGQHGSGAARFAAPTGRCVPGGFNMHKHWWSGRYRVDACPKW